MGAVVHQIPTIILPTLGTGIEAINDILEHTSIEVDTLDQLQEKQVFVSCTEVFTGAAPGNLWLWIELSPVNSTLSTAYWAAIGGGGGAVAPVAPTIVVPTAVTGTIQGILLPWTIHSEFARVVAQMPVAGGGAIATDGWTVQAMFSAKT